MVRLAQAGLTRPALAGQFNREVRPHCVDRVQRHDCRYEISHLARFDAWRLYGILLYEFSVSQRLLGLN